MTAPDRHDHDHARRLAAELSMVSRRRALRFLGGAGAATFLAACGPSKRAGSADTSTTAASTTAASTTAASTTAVTTAVTATPGLIPEETAGPFPGDGSNGVNVLTESGIVRSDIRPSFGSSSVV